MKGKHVFWVVSAIVGVVAMAAGVALFVNKYLNERKTCTEYIECDCSEDEE